MMPWTLKFLWSPFLEMFKTKKFFVVLTQMVTGAGFALVALALQLPVFFAVCIALLAVIASVEPHTMWLRTVSTCRN